MTSNPRISPDVRSRRYPFLRFVALALCMLAIAVAWDPTTTSAFFIHNGPAAESFGPDGTAATRFSGEVSLAFQAASERLYSLKREDGALYGFDASTPTTHPPLPGISPFATGALQPPLLAVDNSSGPSAGNVYLGGGTNHGSEVFGFSAAPANLPGWPIILPSSGISGNGAKGIAVDFTTGDVWIADFQGKDHEYAVRRYTAAGAPLSSVLVNEPLGPANGIAVDSNGDLYVAIEGNLYRFPAPEYQTHTLIAPTSGKPHIPLAVDPSTHDIYLADDEAIRRYTPDGDLIEQFATELNSITGIALNPASGDVYVAARPDLGDRQILRYSGLPLPQVITGATAAPTASSVTLNGSVRPDAVALTDCHFEYVTEAAFQATGFVDLSSGGSLPCIPPFGSIPPDSATHSVSATATGLDPTLSYRFRLVAANANGESSGQSAAFSFGPPEVETTGTPLRTATTALLQGRLYPHGLESTYYFEYGDQGPCDANPCTATAAHPVAGADEVKLVAQPLEGLLPGTTYHYRLLGDNGSPAAGADLTLTTRATDAPLNHGSFPGPPGSDRAWEQVSLPDTGGNPVRAGYGVSAAGDRAFYVVAGGTPLSPSGNLSNLLFAQREETAAHQGGWLASNPQPPRDQLDGGRWFEPADNADLSDQVVEVFVSKEGGEANEIWRLRPGQPPLKLYDTSAPLVSADASRVVVSLPGSPDSDHPVPNSGPNLYDVSTGTPHLVGLLPDDSVPICGAKVGGGILPPRAAHLLSADGSLLFFESCSGLYVRDIPAEQTHQVAPGGSFLSSSPDAAFFTTAQSLAPGDSGGTDVYRYDLATEALKCLTCVPGPQADSGDVVVSEDGSRLYFTSPNRLLPGAAVPGLYRLTVSAGDLAYLVPAPPHFGPRIHDGNAISPNGSVLVFASSDPRLNPLGGLQNNGLLQFYRYDDHDRSLTCLTCPQDGSASTATVDSELVQLPGEEVGANRTALSADGSIFAFTTSTRLLPADQNSARPGQPQSVGADAYEWRDGRLLLVSDGLTEWSDEGPRISALTPSGRDLFFTEAAQLTPDALDGYRRLYDARIGGGFEYPERPKPCPLEVCQGTPKGPPNLPSPATESTTGLERAPHNPRPCPRGRHRRHGKCVPKHAKKRHHRAAGQTGRSGR